MSNYALGLSPDRPYSFRNGARLKIDRAVDHVPIIEIFLNEEYGEIPDNSVVLDLGANVGTFSIYASATAKNVRVYAYEPLPAFFEALRQNVQMNDRENDIQCFNLAVAGEAATARLLLVGGEKVFFPTLVDAENGVGANQVSVACTTLSEIIETNQLAHVDLLKMDCEGAEYEILPGTPPSCLEKIHEIRMEYHDLDSQSRNVSSLKQFLMKSGYRITHFQATTEKNGVLWAAR